MTATKRRLQERRRQNQALAQQDAANRCELCKRDLRDGRLSIRGHMVCLFGCAHDAIERWGDPLETTR